MAFISDGVEMLEPTNYVIILFKRKNMADKS